MYISLAGLIFIVYVINLFSEKEEDYDNPDGIINPPED